jgi:hypothetical protein
MKIPVDTTFDGKDPYRILGVPVEADPAVIRKAYLDLARKNHPNLFATDPEKYLSSTARMQDINAAYELLGDPARREFWDRGHPAARKSVSRPAPKRSRQRAAGPVSPYANLVIRKYNEFVSSLRTPTERQDAVRRIREFQETPAGAAYIKHLVDRHYREAIDDLGSSGRVFDDGLVRITLLSDGAIEIAPGNVFISYACLVYRANRGGPPAEPPARRHARASRPADYRLRMPRAHRDHAPPGPGSNRLWSRTWEWLMAKPGSRPR